MPSPFVTCAGTQFELNGKPFFAFGFNCYFLAYCTDESRRAAIATAKQMGASVLRCWAFLAKQNPAAGEVVFQYTRDGKIHIKDGPDGLQRLDALIKAAEDNDIKLILPLVNYWDDLGGMSFYVNCFSPGSHVTEFYRSTAIWNAYLEWVDHLLSRRNTITGRLYSEEPAIMAWELTNEARCPAPGNHHLLTNWVREMSAFVKNRDPNHLLALGDEGMFCKMGSGHLYDGSHGVDWHTNLLIPEIDFGTYHCYPQSWGKAGDLRMASRWIRDHQDGARSLNKPVLLEEFGLKVDGLHISSLTERHSWLVKWMQTLRLTGAPGALLWMLGQQSPDTQNYLDDYVVYGPADIPDLLKNSSASYSSGISGQGKESPG